MRAARRVAQMNAMRRWREAERIAIFWDLVEAQGLTLEQLTTRVREVLMSQAMEIQKYVDQKLDDARGESTTRAAPDGAWTSPPDP